MFYKFLFGLIGAWFVIVMVVFLYFLCSIIIDFIESLTRKCNISFFKQFKASIKMLRNVETYD